MAFIALLTALVLIHNLGGLLGAEVKSSIIGGTDAEKGQWPWMAYLYMDDDSKNWRCGGSFIHEQWVLTAASCWRYPTPNIKKAMVWVGAYQLKKAAAEYIGVKRVTVHYNFKALSTGYVNNIALVELAEPIPETVQFKLVSLPKSKVSPGLSSECWIAGWGDVGRNNPLPGAETLQQLNIPIISDNVCKKKRPELTDKMLCAGGKAGEDACKGDYGGPLMCKEGDNIVQVGIISYSDCGQTDRPGIYTKVSEYLDYIKEYGPPPKKASAEM